MNPTVFAMRRPVTTLMFVVALISGGVLAYNRMRVDIFPALNTPKIYVFLDYIGMSPDQMEGFIVNQLELYFQQDPTASKGDHPWAPVNGSERVILGDLSILADGERVEVVSGPGQAKVAS